jgi:hypothetical protein
LEEEDQVRNDEDRAMDVARNMYETVRHGISLSPCAGFEVQNRVTVSRLCCLSRYFPRCLSSFHSPSVWRRNLKSVSTLLTPTSRTSVSLLSKLSFTRNVT